MIRRFCALVISGIGLVALLATTAGLASAHAQYQSSSPPANGTIAATPSTIQVTWTQELASLQLTINGPDGSNVVNGPAAIDLAQRHNGSVAIRDAGPGQYLVLWHNVSDDDGDPNDGSFVFTVAGTPAQTVAAPTTPNPPAAGTNPPAAPPTKPVVSAQGCVDDGTVTKGIADFRANTYCKRQAVREQYKGKIDENVFNFDLSIGMGLESSLKAAMAGGG